MPEEILRLKTTVLVDESVANVNRFTNALEQAQNKWRRGAQQSAPIWSNLTNTIKTFNREVGLAVPGFTKLAGSLGALASGTGLVLLARRLGETAEKVGELHRAARNLGTGERSLEALAGAAAKVGVSAEDAVEGVTSFNLLIQKLPTNLGGVRDALEEVGLGQFARELQQIKDPIERTVRLLNFKESLRGQPDALLKMTELLNRTGLGQKFLNVTGEEYRRSQQRSWELTERQVKQLKEFNDSLIDTGRLYTELATKISAEVAPFFTTHMQDLLTFIDKIKDAIKATDELRNKYGMHEQINKILPQSTLRGRSMLDANIEELRKDQGPTIPGGGSALGSVMRSMGIPGFQAGGISAGGLAMLHPGEAVVPLKGGAIPVSIQGGAARDPLQGSDEILTRTTKEGTYQALMDFQSYLEATRAAGGPGGLGTGSVGGGGGGGAGGAGGGGAGLGGGPGGSQSSTGGDTPERPAGSTATPSADELLAQHKMPTGAMTPLVKDAAGNLVRGEAPAEVPAATGGAQGGGGGGNLSKEAYNKMFPSGPLAGQYDKVVAAAQANNVPPATMAAVMAHETGKGTSKMLLSKNNPAGLMTKGGAGTSGQTFATIGEGIDAAGKSIGRQYNRHGRTIAGMQEAYAPTKNATNDPGGLNKSWTSGVSKYEQTLRGDGSAKVASLEPMAPPGTSGPSLSTDTPPNAPGKGLSGPQALALAQRHMGLDEIADRGKLQSYFASQGLKLDPAATPWCAGYVNSILHEQGIKGTGSLAAASFFKFGTAVKPGDVKPGDIGVRGHHVGFLTGRVNARGQYEMVGGNQGGTSSGRGGVSTRWQSIEAIRRAPPSEGGGPAVAAKALEFSKPAITPGGVPGFGGAPAGATAPPGGGMSRIQDPAYLAEMQSQQNRFITSDTVQKRLMEESRGQPSVVDRANGAQTSIPKSSVSTVINTNGTKASASVKSEGPGFAPSKVKTVQQAQPTEASQAGTSP